MRCATPVVRGPSLALAAALAALAGPLSAAPGAPARVNAEPAGAVEDTEAGDRPEGEVDGPGDGAPGEVDRLKRLTIEELMNLEVSSVSKQPERQREAAAAVFVITADDIRRSGVRSLPDALRLAPGVHVAQIDSNKWAVGIRGFASRFSRAVLVLVDGRSVYTPLFAGTYWEVQDLLLEDIDRIEVIRGPGGTLWGANAFNGVINIITKSARDTHGGLLELAAGTEERWSAAVRQGGETPGGVHWRAWAKGFERDAGWRSDDVAYDDWGMGRAGFRFDWDDGTAPAAASGEPSGDGDGDGDGDVSAGRHRDEFLVEGDLFEGYAGQRSDVITFTPPFLSSLDENADVRGAHVLGRWSRSLQGGGQTTLQAWADWTRRDENIFRERRTTLDVDFQHRTRRRGAHELIWGGNYRLTSDDIESMPFLGVDPESREVGLFGAFIQDEVFLGEEERVRLTFGAKVEKSQFSDVELQPNVRLLWEPDSAHDHVFWGAVSRATRTPSRVEEDLALTQPPDPMTGVFPRLIGPGNFESETITAFEAGWRMRPYRGAFVDVAAFYNLLGELQGFEPGTPFVELDPGPPHVVLPLVLNNTLEGHSYGGELAAAIDLGERWRLHLAYSYIKLHLEREKGAADTFLIQAEGQVPRHQVVVRSHADLPRDWTLDVVVRWIDDLPADGVDDYFSADLRVGWSPRPNLEIAIVGQDLLAPHHREFLGPQILSVFGGSEVQRGVYGIVTWRY